MPETGQSLGQPAMADKVGWKDRLRKLNPFGNSNPEHRAQTHINPSLGPSAHPVAYEDRLNLMSLEMARADSRQFARKMGDLLDFQEHLWKFGSRVAVRSFSNPPREGDLSYEVGPISSGQHGLSTEGTSIQVHKAELGDGRMILLRSRGQNGGARTGLATSYPAALLGIEGAADVLEINSHTDDRTKSAISELAEQQKGIKEGCKTIYVFASNGKFGKLITLPKEVQDDRPVVDSNYMIDLFSSERPLMVRTNLVVAEMGPRDFELASSTLETLTSAFNRAKSSMPREIESERRGEP